MSKILIVEDNRDISRIYKSELDFNEFETLVINSGAEVFQMLEDYKPDLVLLDIMLPDMSGIDVLKKIKGDERFKKTKTIIISNIDAPAVINEAFSNGADGYLIKSIILPSQLTDEVKNFLK